MLAAIARASGGRVLWAELEPHDGAAAGALRAPEPQRSSA
jgi:hypothetical protein